MFFQKIFIVLIIMVSFCNALQRVKTITSFRIFRHGARFQKIKEEFYLSGVKFSKDKSSMLTEIGKQQNLKKGQYYKQIDTEELKDNSIFYSSHSQRCQESGQAFLSGYDNPQKIIVLDKKYTHPLIIDKTKTIVPENIDQLIDRAEKEGLIEYLRVINFPFKKIKSGQQIYMLKHAFTCFYCLLSMNIIVPEMNAELYFALREAFQEFYMYYYQIKDSVKGYSQSMLQLLGKQISNIYINEGGTLDEQIKTYFNGIDLDYNNNLIYFGHNQNIQSFMFRLFKEEQLRDQELLMVPFVGSLEFQLTNMNEVIIKFLDRKIYLPECNNSNCTVDQFLKFLYKKCIIFDQLNQKKQISFFSYQKFSLFQFQEVLSYCNDILLYVENFFFDEIKIYYYVIFV